MIPLGGSNPNITIGRVMLSEKRRIAKSTIFVKAKTTKFLRLFSSSLVSSKCFCSSISGSLPGSSWSPSNNFVKASASSSSFSSEKGLVSCLSGGNTLYHSGHKSKLSQISAHRLKANPGTFSGPCTSWLQFSPICLCPRSHVWETKGMASPQTLNMSVVASVLPLLLLAFKNIFR